MIVLHRETVAAQRAGHSLAGVTRARVDDRAPLADRAEPLHEDPQPVLVPGHLLHVVAEVLANDARSDDGHLAAEGGGDAGGSRRRGGRRHAEHRRLAERLECPSDEEVVGSEVVTPHADAVHLVDHDEADADRAELLDERRIAEPLGGRVQQSGSPGDDVIESASGLVCLERGVDERRCCSDLGRELIDLILHQRDQRRENERRLGAQHRGELVGERLAGSRRHQRERVAAVDGSAHDLFLAGSEVREAEELVQAWPQVVHANKCTG